MSECPTCGVEGCYNSGFTVECQSPECTFFSQKQVDLLWDEHAENSEDVPRNAVIRITEGEITTHRRLSGLWRSGGSDISLVPGPLPTDEEIKELRRELIERLRRHGSSSDLGPIQDRCSGAPIPCGEIALDAGGECLLGKGD